MNADQWLELKGSYKALNLRMPCCQTPAVPKTSTIGNFFFAHARRGECNTAPESVEHIFCKVLIANAAAAAGWMVTTERAGVSPNGDAWVADVFCEKGTTKVALEVQMSPQTREEASKRQTRYKDSGVRAAWFYGEKLHRRLGAPSKDLPIFTLTAVTVGQEPKIFQMDKSLTDFVTALLNKQVTWVHPEHTEPLYISYLRHTCQHCNRSARLPYGHASTLAELRVEPASLEAMVAAMGRLSEAITNAELDLLGLCHISQVHPIRGGVSYVNGCQRCQVVVENWFLFDRVTRAANGRLEPSCLGHIYFDRNVRDSGTWKLVTEAGAYTALPAS
jgi:hypothetical protein